jgi:4-amino-4-deoxy-L-arabinose transferase-like glycosyltransferase
MWMRCRRNALATCNLRDWVTAHLDGVPYLEKAPLVCWSIAFSGKSLALTIGRRASHCVVGCGSLLAYRGHGAFGHSERAGFYAGLIMATCVGLFLFTRTLIPDVMLTFTVALAVWAFLRTLDEDSRIRVFVLAVNLG